MRFTDITGLISSIVLLTTVVSLIFPVTGWNLGRRWLVLLVCVFLAQIPFGPLPAAAVFVRGYIGDLSTTSVLVLLLILIDRLFGLRPVDRRTIDGLCLWFFPLGLAFYPLALGLGRFDPYAFGFGSPYLLGLIFLITLFAWTIGQTLLAVSLAISVLCYALGWYESNNLWDYLVDPLLLIYALATMINRHCRPVGVQAEGCGSKQERRTSGISSGSR